MGFILARAIAAFFLFWATVPHKFYDYFTLLRIYICCVSIYGAWYAVHKKKLPMAFIFGNLAYLFNPLIPLTLEARTWKYVDALCGLFMLISIYFLHDEPEDETERDLPGAKSIAFDKHFRTSSRQALRNSLAQDIEMQSVSAPPLAMRKETPPPQGNAARKRLFDAYVAVNWMASPLSSAGSDSIWIAHSTGPDTTDAEEFHNRRMAYEQLAELLKRHAAKNRKVFVGMDFNFGYSYGFAKALQKNREDAGWFTTWNAISETSRNEAVLFSGHSSSFDLAASLNKRVSGNPGPFYECPEEFAGTSLAQIKPQFPFATSGGRNIEEMRHTEKMLASRGIVLQSVWRLLGKGSQGLMGIPVLRALRFHDSLSRHSRIWPFETGFSASHFDPAGAFILYAETCTETLKSNVPLPDSGDASNAVYFASRFAKLDAEGKLEKLFAPPVEDTKILKEAVEEEGWILGAGIEL